MLHTGTRQTQLTCQLMYLLTFGMCLNFLLCHCNMYVSMCMCYSEFVTVFHPWLGWAYQEIFNPGLSSYTANDLRESSL